MGGNTTTAQTDHSTNEACTCRCHTVPQPGSGHIIPCCTICHICGTQIAYEHRLEHYLRQHQSPPRTE